MNLYVIYMNCMIKYDRRHTTNIADIIGDFRSQLLKLLEDTREYLGVDSAYLVNLEPSGESNTIAPDSATPLDCADIKDMMPETFGKIMEGIPVVGGIESFPRNEQKILKAKGISSLVVFPVPDGNGHPDMCLVCISAKAKDISADEMTYLVATISRIRRTLSRIATLVAVEKDHFLLENTNDVIFAYDANGMVTYVSGSFERITPFRRSDMVGHSIFEFLRPEDHDRARERLELLKQGIGEISEYRIGERWYRFNCHPVMANGRLKETVSIMTDITELKEVEQTLKESEERYRLLAENIRDMVSMWDLNLNLVYVNPAIRTILGYTPAEAMDSILSPFDVMTKKSRKIMEKLYDERMASDPGPNIPGRQMAMELELIRKDGQPIQTETKLSFARNEKGERIGIIAVTRDITERSRRWEDPGTVLEEMDRILAGEKFILWTTDMRIRYTYVSPSVENILGYPDEEFISMEGKDTMDEVSFNRLSSAFYEGLIFAREKGTPWKTTIEITQKTRTGKKLKGELILMLTRNRKGEAKGFVALTRFSA